MENVAIVIIIIEGVLLITVMIALIALVVSLKNMMALLTEKIDPAIEAISKFAQDINQRTDDKGGLMSTVLGNGIINKLYTLYKYISVIPDVMRNQKK